MDPSSIKDGGISPAVSETAAQTSTSRWKPRGRSGWGFSRKGRGRGKGKGTGPRGRKLTAQQASERLIIIACIILGFCVTGFAGFVIGRKSQPKEHVPASSPLLEIEATGENREKFSTAFSDLRSGNAKGALLAFQGIQASQPGLFGVDFLIGYAAYFAGESALARESFRTAIGKKELDVESDAFVALLDVSSNDKGVAGASIADPVASAESALNVYATRRPLDPRADYLRAEMLRTKGSYRTAAESMAMALGKTDPRFDPRLIEAKTSLMQLQNKPPSEVPSVELADRMQAPEAVAAAYSAFINKHTEEGIVFLQRASLLYPAPIFRQLLLDQAFDDFRPDPKFKEFSGNF